MCPRKDWEGVNERQRNRLEQRVSSKKTREENWYIIFDVLFPGAERPESPYLNLEFADGLLALRDFTARELSGVVREVLNREPLGTDIALGLNNENFAEQLFQSFFDLLLERFESRRPNDALIALQERLRSSMQAGNSGQTVQTSSEVLSSNITVEDPLQYIFWDWGNDTTTTSDVIGPDLSTFPV